MVKDSLNHGKLHELAARENYTQYLKFVLKHDISVRETSLLIQPNLFWLASSPDGLVSDHSNSRKVGFIEIECSKLNVITPLRKYYRYQILCRL